MDIRFDGKRALVTGAGKGIGRAVTTKLAQLGAEVVAISRTQTDLDELSAISPNIKTICLDIGDWEATRSALKDVGNIDLLVNNAAKFGPSFSESLTEEDFDSVFDVNVKAPLNIGMVILKQMKDSGNGGSVVNVSSLVSLKTSSSAGPYFYSKAALDQLTKSMAVIFGPHKIRVNSVNPTLVRTKTIVNQIKEDKYLPKLQYYEGRTPLGKLGEIEDVVDPILFLLSEKARMISGVCLPIDGGLSIVL